MAKFKNYIGIIFLIFIMLIFIVGGFFTMRYFTQEKKINKTKTEKKEEIDLRIDQNKDYFYFDNEEELIASMEIEYLEPVFNIQGAEEINKKLKEEVQSLKKTIKYYTDSELPEGTEGNEEKIYSLNYRDYREYSYGKYLSLAVLDYSYDLVNGSVPINLNAYVINKETGQSLTKEELMQEFNVTNDTITQKVKEKLDANVILYEKSGVSVDVNASLNYLNNYYALYVNKFGELEVSFVVKTSENIYNDTVTINK